MNLSDMSSEATARTDRPAQQTLGGVPSSELKVIYDEIYDRYAGREAECPVTTGDIAKARTRIRQVLKAYGLMPRAAGLRVLDIGCGLGSTSEVFREIGSTVTALDLSKVAIAQAKKRFPGIDFRCQMFPDELEPGATFDLIWAVDVPGVGVSDAGQVVTEFLESALKFLKQDGCLVIGWHTDFSGNRKGSWVHWSAAQVKELRRLFRASPVLIPPLRFLWLSRIACFLCRHFRRSAPIYFVVRAVDWSGYDKEGGKERLGQETGDSTCTGR
ncbi:MAG: class I SAM-dependent methyltransferase [Verrucomicrobiaceae bacterium]|nr:MAG: class I SAM-dependent methyltransferase [Verrucomicrobiaceae bacterium]